MPPSRKEWADAYWMQSRSDWDTFHRVLAKLPVLNASRLHFLQMACEKIAKAYRFRDTNTKAETLLTRHVALSRFMPSFIRSQVVKAEYQGRDAQLNAALVELTAIAREVEKLAPGVDRPNSPENAEYPWEAGGKVVHPAEYTFPNLSMLRDPAGQNFLRLMGRAIDEFRSITIQ